MNRKKVCLKNIAKIGGVLGIAFLLFGLSMIILKLDFNFPNKSSAPWGFILVGVLIILISIAPLIESQKDNNIILHFSRSYFDSHM